MTKQLSALAFVALAACGGGSGGGGGGGSGLPSGTKVAALSDGDVTELCTYFVSLEEQPARTVDCGGGVTATTGVNPADVQAAIDDCVQSSPSGTCPATVGQSEDCFEAFADLTDAELCALFNGGEPPAACAPLNDPACG